MIVKNEKRNAATQQDTGSQQTRHKRTAHTCFENGPSCRLCSSVRPRSSSAAACCCCSGPSGGCTEAGTVQHRGGGGGVTRSRPAVFGQQCNLKPRASHLKLQHDQVVWVAGDRKAIKADEF